MIGIDLIEISRITKLCEKAEFVKKILHPQEMEYVVQFDNKFEHIAGFFCCKEAVMKALGNCKELVFNDIMVCHEETGMPYVKLFGKAKEEFNKLSDSKNIYVSISHSKIFATAIAIIYDRQQNIDFI